jgi:hypothetical protein
MVTNIPTSLAMSAVCLVTIAMVPAGHARSRLQSAPCVSAHRAKSWRGRGLPPTRSMGE